MQWLPLYEGDLVARRTPIDLDSQRLVTELRARSNHCNTSKSSFPVGLNAQSQWFINLYNFYLLILYLRRRHWWLLNVYLSFTSNIAITSILHPKNFFGTTFSRKDLLIPEIQIICFFAMKWARDNAVLGRNERDLGRFFKFEPRESLAIKVMRDNKVSIS